MRSGPLTQQRRPRWTRTSRRTRLAPLTRLTRFITLGVLGLLMVGRADAQQPAGRTTTPKGGTRADLPTTLAPAARDTLGRLLDSAQAMGLPVEPLTSKVAEGVLKRASDARIVHAVRTLLSELSDARRALPSGASPGAMAAGASALHAGVSERQLRLLWSGRDPVDAATLAAALVTLADLAALRVPPEEAANSLRTLLDRHVDAAGIDAFRAAVSADITAGQPVMDALRRRIPPAGG